MEDDRGRELYSQIGQGMAGIAGAITFIGAYIYCISEYGFLLGFGFGWIPSALLAMIVYGVTLVVWPLALVAVIYVVVKIVS